MTTILTPGATFPKMTLPQVGGGEVTLGTADDWQLVIVYRGAHCPLCKKYLTTLEGLRARFEDLGVSVAVVSGDPETKAVPFLAEAGYTGPVAHSLSIAQMKELGLMISDPRSPQETDQPFAEPGLFVINAEGNIQILDISNAPFARPDLESLLGGLQFVRANDYPIRGMHGQ